MNRSKFHTVSLCLALIGAGAALSACSSKSNPAGGGPGGGNPGQVSQAIDAVHQQFFVANTGPFLSINFFGPLISVLTGNPVALDRYLPPGAAAVSCINPALLGVVFDYNGSVYVPTGAAGAPAEGARFLLYEVSSTGVVNTANQIGYFDVTCTGTTPNIQMSLEIVIAGQQRAVGTFSGQYPVSYSVMALQATVFDNQGVGLTLDGFIQDHVPGAVINDGTQTRVHLVKNNLEFSYSVVEDNTSSDSEEGASAVDYSGTAPWSVSTQLYADGAGSVLNGFAVYSDNTAALTVGCFGGTLDAPTISTSGGCTQVGTVDGTYPLGDIADVTTSHLILRSMYDPFRAIMVALLATVDVS